MNSLVRPSLTINWQKHFQNIFYVYNIKKFVWNMCNWYDWYFSVARLEIWNHASQCFTATLSIGALSYSWHFCRYTCELVYPYFNMKTENWCNRHQENIVTAKTLLRYIKHTFWNFFQDRSMYQLKTFLRSCSCGQFLGSRSAINERIQGITVHATKLFLFCLTIMRQLKEIVVWTVIERLKIFQIY